MSDSDVSIRMNFPFIQEIPSTVSSNQAEEARAPFLPKRPASTTASPLRTEVGGSSTKTANITSSTPLRTDGNSGLAAIFRTEKHW